MQHRRCEIAITESYVDPSINANSGSGTIGDPWGDLQYALNTKTRDATNGDRFNVKAGTAEVLAAALTLATYGTPTAAAPLFFQGYTSAAGDGGIGEISGAASYSVISSSTYAYTSFVDMKLHNTGANRVARLGAGSGFYNCEIYNSSAAGIQLGVTIVAGCYIHDCATGIDGSAQSGTILGCYFANGGTRDFTTAIDMGVASTFAIGNIIVLDDASIGIKASANNLIIHSNSIYCAGGTGKGIYLASGAVALVANNIVEGFSGSGGLGIRIDSGGTAWLMAANAVYNNTTNISDAGAIRLQPAADDTLSGSAFVNAGAGDFDINGTVTGVTEDGWPATWPQLAATLSKMDKGAVQAGTGAGGVIRRVARILGK